MNSSPAKQVRRLPRVFVSYATPDGVLAKALVMFLRLGCNLAEEQVFMTDRPGTLSPGIDFTEAIREALEEADMAILLLTPSFYESRFCLAEAGAVWVREKTHVPMVVPPIDFHALDGVQLGREASRINVERDLDEVRDLIEEVTDQKVSTGAWNEHKTEFLNRWTAEFEGNIATPETVEIAEFETLSQVNE